MERASSVCDAAGLMVDSHVSTKPDHRVPCPPKTPPVAEPDIVAALPASDSRFNPVIMPPSSPLPSPTSLWKIPSPPCAVARLPLLPPPPPSYFKMW